MSLMVRARIKAGAHMLHPKRFFNPDHCIWRVTRWWGFDVSLVMCSCGKVFGEHVEHRSVRDQNLVMGFRERIRDAARRRQKQENPT